MRETLQPVCALFGCMRSTVWRPFTGQVRDRLFRQLDQAKLKLAYLCLSANDRRPILFVLTIKRTSELTGENAEQVNMQNRTQSYKATIDPGSELPDEELQNFQKVRIPEKSANRP